MKKVLAVVLALALELSMCACGKTNSPEGTVSAFCDAMKSFDFNKLKDYTKGGIANTELDTSDVPEGLMTILKTWAKDLKYKVGKAEINGNDATVKVDFTYTDAGPILKAALADYLTKAISMALTGDTSEEAMVKLLVECIESAQKNTKADSKQVTIPFYLEQVDGKWLVKDTASDLANVLFSNFMESFSGLFD